MSKYKNMSNKISFMSLPQIHASFSARIVIVEDKQTKICRNMHIK